jgi:hypothetical protein
LRDASPSGGEIVVNNGILTIMINEGFHRENKMKKVLRIILTWVVILGVLTVCGISIYGLIESQKSAKVTPDPNVPLTLNQTCDYYSNTVEVEGRLYLSKSTTCTTEEPFTCEMYLYNPYWSDYINLDIPVYKGTGNPPMNSMADLPEGFSRADLLITAADNRIARNGSFVKVRGKATGSLTTCRIYKIESIQVLDRLVVEVGLNLTKVTLKQALTEGLVIATITGDGLTQVQLKIKPKVDINLELVVEPGTMLISGTEGVQNMVIRKEETIYLKPNLEVGVDLEASCANMELKQPTHADGFTVSNEPTNEDLVLLLNIDGFPFLDQALQQFAIWTITDNPAGSGYYVGIDTGEETLVPMPDQIVEMRRLFLEAGIDIAKYLIFSN